MKLRNKKTGEIIEFNTFSFRSDSSNGWEDFVPHASSLEELNAEWEDYVPKEPLIKDEKIRKTVKAWADMNGFKEVYYIILGDGFSTFVKDDLEINFTFQVEGVQDDKRYTITELCGEEE